MEDVPVASSMTIATNKRWIDEIALLHHCCDVSRNCGKVFCAIGKQEFFVAKSPKDRDARYP